MKDKYILAIYPNGKGFGYVVMENNRLISFGNGIANPISNTKLLSKVEKLLEFFNPDIVLLPQGKHGKRISLLLGCLKKIVEHHGKQCLVYTRQQIQFVFSHFEAKSKYEIAIELIKQFPELENRMPVKRKAFTSDDYNMGVFDGMSLVVAYKYLEVI